MVQTERRVEPALQLWTRFWLVGSTSLREVPPTLRQNASFSILRWSGKIIHMLDTGWKSAMVLLGAVLVLSAATRLIGLSQAPPALIPDEASNGYDAYCLLETGKDRWGESWPVLLEAFGKGDHRPALYAYMTMPFLVLLGPERFDLVTRLPAAGCGVLAVGCFYLVVSRVCGRQAALWAALLLALSPWHIRMSRFGHESALTPVFTILALLMLSCSGWPLGRPTGDSASPLRLRWGWMVGFGVVVGLGLYCYGSMKPFVPAMLLAGALIYRSLWWRILRDPTSRIALMAGVVAFLVVIAPLAYLTVTQWSSVNNRAEYVSLFHQGLTLADALKQAGVQYLAHFGPTWLFIRGDTSALSSTPHVGQLNWYMLPLILAGLVFMWHRWKCNRVYALILAWLLLHPLASALCTDGPHTNRAACGIGVFQWIAAIGIAGLTSWHWLGGRRLSINPVAQASSLHSKQGVAHGFSRGGRESADHSCPPPLKRWATHTSVIHRINRGRALVVCSLLLAVILANAAWSMSHYFVFVRQPGMTYLYQTDLRDAVFFLRDCWTDYDRIFISDHASNEHQWANLHPYIYVLAYMPIEPETFQAWGKTVGYRQPQHGFHYVESMGPFTFSTDPRVLAEHFRKHPRQRVLIVGRPGDISGGRLLHTIKGIRGNARFELIEVIPPGAP